MPVKVRPKPRVEIIPRTLRKILVTAAIGIPTYFLTDDNGPWNATGNEASAWGLILTVFISTVVFLTQYLLEVDRQLDSTRQDISDGLSRINEATELFGLVEASAVQTDVVTQLVRNATRVDKEMPQLIQAFAQGEIARISTLLRELGEGNVIYEGEDRDWLLGLTKNTLHSIDALSLNAVDQGVGEIDGGFWTTDAGQRYLEAQRDRRREGVRIRRIFFLERSEHMESEMFRRICKMHMETGVEVRVLTPEALVTPLGLFDFIIFDDVVSYEVTPSTPQVGQLVTHTFVHTLLVLEQPRVKQRIDRFRELWNVAKTPE